VVTDPTHQHNVGSNDSTAQAGSDAGNQEFVRNSGAGNGPTTTTNFTSTGITVATATTTTTANAGVSGTNANLPPYYALAYVMKS
jgi:microcystin-dependent protein